MTKRTCSVPGCDRPHSSIGFCAMHGLRWRTKGDVGDVNPLRRSKPVDLGRRDQIELTQGMVALVDEEDYDRVMAVGLWYAKTGKGTSYARHTLSRRRGSSGPRFISMHRFIMEAEPGQEIDHRNCNGLDNRRSNLRFATRIENILNRWSRGNGTSEYKGVSRSRSGLWRTKMNDRSLGLFVDEEDAARAWDKAARELHGEFAYLNFPDEA